MGCPGKDSELTSSGSDQGYSGKDSESKSTASSSEQEYSGAHSEVYSGKDSELLPSGGHQECSGKDTELRFPQAKAGTKEVRAVHSKEKDTQFLLAKPLYHHTVDLKKKPFKAIKSK